MRCESRSFPDSPRFADRVAGGEPSFIPDPIGYGGLCFSGKETWRGTAGPCSQPSNHPGGKSAAGMITEAPLPRASYGTASSSRAISMIRSSQPCVVSCDWICSAHSGKASGEIRGVSTITSSSVTSRSSAARRR